MRYWSEVEEEEVCQRKSKRRVSPTICAHNREQMPCASAISRLTVALSASALDANGASRVAACATSQPPPQSDALACAECRWHRLSLRLLIAHLPLTPLAVLPRLSSQSLAAPCSLCCIARLVVGLLRRSRCHRQHRRADRKYADGKLLCK